jgi:hypothetical protein
MHRKEQEQSGPILDTQHCDNASRRALESQRTKEGVCRGGNKTVLCVVDNVLLTCRGAGDMNLTKQI